MRALVSASGEILNVSGKADIPVKIGGMTINLQVLILSRLTSKFILGTDSLTKCKASINFASGMLSLFDDTVVVPLQCATDKSAMNCNVSEQIGLC